MSEIDTLVENYWRWLRDKTVIKRIGNWSEITTPYLDRHNDYIQIYAKKSDQQFIISDDGYTSSDLEQSGCSLDSPKRQEILQSILNGFAVSNVGGELQSTANQENFPVRKHNFIQAILSINDMFFLASPTVEALFLEDVTSWLEDHDIRCTPRVKFSGKSGFDHMFDFAIPKSRLANERIIRAINNPKRETALNFITAWSDTKDTRPSNAAPFAFLNDNEKGIGANVIDALSNYGITPIIWSERDKFIDQLAA